MENDTLLKVYTTKVFNSETSRYKLSDPIYIDPTTINFQEDKHYYYQKETIQYNQSTEKLYTSSNNESIIVYEIISASKSTTNAKWNNILYDAINYKLTLQTLEEDELELDSSDKGIYQGTDTYGKTYYYRGNVKNNNIYFAGFYWKIVRINSDGSIRLIYNGTEKNSEGVMQSINNNTYRFNNKYNDPTYVGYMYGTPSSNNYEEIYANNNDSTIKSVLEAWFKEKLVNNNYEKYIAQSASFCGERALTSTDNQNIRFSSLERYTKGLASFNCLNPNRDLYTVKNSGYGNESLQYPIGLITYDELVYAGMDNNHLNKLSYVYSSENYWTMSPAYFNFTWNDAFNIIQNSEGYLNSWWSVSFSLGARPVINLKSDVKIAGGIGTSSDPYSVTENQ